MTHGSLWVAFAVWTILCLIIAAGVVAVGYLAYKARRAREEARLEARAPGPDPVDELSEVNDVLAERLREGRRSLEATREAVREGVRW